MPVKPENNNIETIVAEAVKAKVQVMVVDALGEPGALVKQIVAEALTLKITGKNYPYKTEPLIHQITRTAIVDEAKRVMVEFIDEQRDAIRAELKRRLTASKNEIADALLQSVVRTAGASYGITVKFTEKGE